jgi:hypothetical protein
MTNPRGRPRQNAEFTVPVDDDADQGAIAAAINQVAPGLVSAVAQGPTPEEIAALRATRQPINGRAIRLQVHGSIPGYHLYIAKDEGARIAMMQQAGYSFVQRGEVDVNRGASSYNTDAGGNVRFILGSNGAEPLYGYLMKLPEQFWLEDQAALEATNAEIDDQIRRGKVRETSDEQRYTPKGGIQYNPQASKLFQPTKP